VVPLRGDQVIEVARVARERDEGLDGEDGGRERDGGEEDAGAENGEGGQGDAGKEGRDQFELLGVAED
jgi:hypothetical protein